MYQVEDEPIVTTHLYVVREAVARPSVAPIVLSLFTLSLLIVLGVTTPYTQPVTRLAIRVPAVLLGIKSFNASVAIIPTGVKAYRATVAHGTLTITNGSIIGQSIPAGFTVQGVATDTAIYVPAGDANGYGKAIVSGHAVTPGVNLPSLAVNAVIGSSLFIRNLSPFTGGHPAYPVKYMTEQDKQVAITTARNQLAATVTGLHYPCIEAVTGHTTVTWRCQLVRLPQLTLLNIHIITIRFVGRNLVIDLTFTPLPKRIWVK